jgi:minor extracellular serine protease Vpr
MKKLITFICIAILSSVNIFAQPEMPDKKSGDIKSKLLNVEIKYADEISSRISPLLNILLNRIDSREDLYAQLPESAGHLGEILYFYRNESNNLVVPVFIKTSSPGYTQTKIAEFEGKTGTVAGDIITAAIPLLKIRELAQSPEIIFIDAGTVSKPKLNISRVESKVDQLHSGTGISRPYKGSGVIVGVLDSGIDWKHQDFKNSGGSRIKYLWDMSGTGSQPSGYSYGTEYIKSQIDANQCLENDGDDGHGHGTHVAGTAAGNGGALISYTGMAPESDIVFVKGFRSSASFGSTDVLDGCNYIFQKAQQAGKPAVINLSLGGHYGPHDGTSLYEQGLSNLTGNGKIIVAAAGNEAGETIHLSYPVSGTSFENAFETFFDLYQNTPVVLANMWYSGGNISVGLAVYNPSTFPDNPIGYTPGIAAGQSIEDAPFTVGGITYGYITIVNQVSNGSNEVIVAIDSHEGQVNISSYYWTIFTYGSGTFDAWMINGGIFSTYIPPNWTWIKPGDNQKTIGMPGTANKVICVGSYVTKDNWIDVNGNPQNQPGNPVMGKISSFSSLGPTRDGRIKPDIVAPGEVIVAAYSSYLTQTPVSNIIQGGKHQKMEGTSMASPHAAGVVALLLEKNAALNYDQTVAILKNTTKKDNFTGSTPNNTYGHGKLDAYNAFSNTPGGGGGGTQTILQEGFDGTFLPANWSQQVTNVSNTWIQSNPSSINFNTIDPSSQFSALCPWVAANQNEWLVSPAFNLGSGDASLEFYAGYSTEWLSSATIKLHISTDGGTNWTQIWTAENDGQTWGWRKKTINLNSFSNQQNLKLGWQYIGNDGDLAALDGVKLLGYVTEAEEEVLTVVEYALEQNYPNPFNPATLISYQLPERGNVSLKVYDILGNEVSVLINEEKPAGKYTLTWNAVKVPSGVYFYELKAGEFTETKKMLLVK